MMSIGEDVETLESSCIAVGGNNGTITLETVWEIFKILNLDLQYDSVISLPGMYPR